jgi:cysteine desulfurase / selenocysteine lyase
MQSYNLPLYRSWFPHLETNTIWLNHASISPLSTRVNAAVTAYMRERTSGAIDVYLDMLTTVQRTKANLGALVNAAPERIGFVGNTSEGLNILANGLDWKTGDRILLNDIEFPTNVVPFLNCHRHGVEIDYVKNVRGEIRLEDIERAITPRTRLLSISFVQFLTGFRADLNAIGALCKQHGVIFCVDSIQGLGVSPLDTAASGIDFLSNGGNKWLMGMMGAGFIFITPELQARIQQCHLGWTSNRNFFGDFFNYRIDPDETARRYENGTQNYCGITALEASTSTLLEVGIGNIAEHVSALTDAVIAMCDELGFDTLTPRDRAHRAGIVSFTCPDPQRMFDRLTANRVMVSMREGMLRIAPHFYNTIEDIGALRSVLAVAARTEKV